MSYFFSYQTYAADSKYPAVGDFKPKDIVVGISFKEATQEILSLSPRLILGYLRTKPLFAGIIIKIETLTGSSFALEESKEET